MRFLVIIASQLCLRISSKEQEVQSVRTEGIKIKLLGLSVTKLRTNLPTDHCGRENVKITAHFPWTFCFQFWDRVCSLDFKSFYTHGKSSLLYFKRVVMCTKNWYTSKLKTGLLSVDSLFFFSVISPVIFNAIASFGFLIRTEDCLCGNIWRVG